MDMVLVPMYLNIAPHIWKTYPEAYKAKTRWLLTRMIGAGWAGNPMMIQDQKMDLGPDDMHWFPE